MAKLIWALPCTQVLTDKETNTASYITCIEAMGVVSLPGKFPNMFIGTNWGRSSKGDKVFPRIRVLASSREEIHKRELEERPFGDFERYRINIRIGDFDIVEPGEYIIAIEHKVGNSWENDSQIPIMIHDISAEQEDEILPENE